MLAYFDESGHPHPNDPATRPVLVAVLLEESQIGRLTRRLYSMRQTILGRLQLNKREREGKAVAFLNRRNLLRFGPEKREYVEQLFNFLRDLPLTCCGIVMERPARVPFHGVPYLQAHYRLILEQIQRFMEIEHPQSMAIPVFDNLDPQNDRIISDCITAYMARSTPGQALHNIVPSPLFADSSLTPGIQIADLFAYVIRVYYENNLRMGHSYEDPYLSAMARFFDVIHGKVCDFPRDDGAGMWYGIRTIPETYFQYDTPSDMPSHAEGLPAIVGSEGPR